jgi:hypothetical protein
MRKLAEVGLGSASQLKIYNTRGWFDRLTREVAKFGYPPYNCGVHGRTTEHPA